MIFLFLMVYSIKELKPMLDFCYPQTWLQKLHFKTQKGVLRRSIVWHFRQKYLETEDKIKTSTQDLWIYKNLNNFVKQAIIFPRSKIQEQYNLILGKCLLRDQSVLAIGAPHHKIFVSADWNKDHRRWSKRCPP